MTLTKKHFEQFAKILARRKSNTLDRILELFEDILLDFADSVFEDTLLEFVDSVFDALIHDLIEYFQKENERFDGYRFIEAICQEFDGLNTDK